MTTLLWILLLQAAGTPAPAPPSAARVGVEERLGAQIPLDDLLLTDEEGGRTSLRPIVDRPVMLVLVYFRCAGICTPLLQEVARLVDLSDLAVGEDYRIVTVSFDPRDTAEIARMKRANFLSGLRKRVPPLGWRFLTAGPEEIRRITEAVGFRYAPAGNGVDFVHEAALVFLTREGRVARYLKGVGFNPAEIKMAVFDAAAGRSRSFMPKAPEVCVTEPPKNRRLVVGVSWIMMGATVAFLAALVLYLRRAGSARGHAGKGGA